jgi:hypothetical protein
MELQGHVITLLILIIRAELISAEICDVREQFQLPLLTKYSLAKITAADGSIVVRGFKYHPGTFWKADVNEDYTTIITCPCLVQKCIQHCSSKLIFLHLIMFHNVESVF